MAVAVIKSKGHQYLVSTGDKLKISKLEGEVGDKVIFDRVLLLDQEIGQPRVKGAVVKGKIIAQKKTPKIIVFKHKPKKRYKKKQGHRQPYTEVEITRILKESK